MIYDYDGWQSYLATYCHLTIDQSCWDIAKHKNDDSGCLCSVSKYNENVKTCGLAENKESCDPLAADTNGSYKGGYVGDYDV
jgi:hypothetical protein